MRPLFLILSFYFVHFFRFTYIPTFKKIRFGIHSQLLKSKFVLFCSWKILKFESRKLGFFRSKSFEINAQVPCCCAHSCVENRVKYVLKINCRSTLCTRLHPFSTFYRKNNSIRKSDLNYMQNRPVKNLFFFLFVHFSTFFQSIFWWKTFQFH